MKSYTNNNPEFHAVIDVMEPTDTNHADHVNATTQPLIDNTLYLKGQQDKHTAELAVCGKSFVQDGSFAIKALGTTRESTVKELCEALLAYRSANKLPLAEVNFWINGSSAIGEEIRELFPDTYGNLNLSCPADTVYLTYRGYYSETPAAIRTCTYTKVNNKHDFSPWTTLEDMTATVARLEKAIEDAKALRASLAAYGMVKVTDSAAVTDSKGLALAATEKNATIQGTLASQLAQLNTDLTNTNMYRAFTICMLNGINFDNVYNYNYVMAATSDDVGTRPPGSVWFNVVNFYSVHFATQLAFSCTDTKDASRDVHMWVRERYAMRPDAVWSSWKTIV